jgi:hypothetical protein
MSKELKGKPDKCQGNAKFKGYRFEELKGLKSLRQCNPETLQPFLS